MAPLGSIGYNGQPVRDPFRGWGICEQGDWWGLVAYPISYGSKQKTVTHWIPAWTLRRKR
jgi:hypothetical protein